MVGSMTRERAKSYLDNPFRRDQRWVLVCRSGKDVDRPARVLARICGTIDVALAVRLDRMRQGDRFLRLGYARFVDYARERLDMPARTAQEIARLGGALERLPALREALSKGRLSWTSALLVARVANRKDVDDWIELAFSVSVRQLAAGIAWVNRPGSEAGPDGGNCAAAAGGPGGDECEVDPAHTGEAGRESRLGKGPERSEKAGPQGPLGGDDDDDTAETPITWRLRTPAVAKRNWDAALELCSLVAQTDLWEPEAIELLLAEFVSGTDGSAVDEASETRVERAAREEARLAAERHARRRRTSSVAEPIQDLPPDWKPPALSRATRAVLKQLSDPVEDDPFSLDASLRKLRQGRRSVELDLAGLLAAFRSLGGWRDLGYETFSEYVQERLGLSSRRARFLTTLDRGLAGLPAVDAAVRSGAVGLVAASLVCRVATRSTADAWLERARQVPVARLRREVAWVQRRADRGAAVPPSFPPFAELPSALDEVTAEVLARAGVVGFGKEAAAAQVSLEAGAGSGPMFAPDVEAASTRGSGPMFAPDVEAASARGSGPMSALDGVGPWARDSAPASVTPGGPSSRSTHVTPSGMFSGTPTRKNAPPQAELRIRLTPHARVLWERCRRALEQARGGRASDADVAEAVADAFLHTWLPFWVEAVLLGDPIAVREKYRCIVPGCTVHGGSAHHIVYRSRGGSDDPRNLAFVCYSHHILGEHAGRLRITGTAPDRLRVELGLRPDGTALETFVGGVRKPGSAATSEAECPQSFRPAQAVDPGSPRRFEPARPGAVVPCSSAFGAP